MDDCKSIIRNYEKLHSEQANFRMLWNTIAQYVMPAWDNFIGEMTEGVVRTTRIFDGSAISANECFAAVMESMLTPRTQQWHDITPADEELADDQDVQEYCALVRKILFRARYRPGANYASEADCCYLQLGAFGNTAMFIDEAPGRSLIYRSIPLNEIVWALDAAGRVDTLYRKFPYSARQCVQKWSLKNLPKPIQEAYEKDPYTEFEILHCVKPNEERIEGAVGAKGMAFASWYLYPDLKHTIAVGGYRVFPYAIGRYRMAPREHYGRSPGAVALPAIRTLNEQKKTALRAAQKAVDPPILLSEEGALTPFNLRAGALNYGMLSGEGTPLAVPFESKGNFELAETMMGMEAQAINDSFLKSYFQLLTQNPGMTATEALIRAQEKGILISPAMGRQQSEFLGPQIIREVDLLSAAGVIPPPPDKLIQSSQKRGISHLIKVEYTSPLAKMLRAEEGQIIQTSIDGLSKMASVRPSVLDNVDWDKTTKHFLDSTGFPAELLLDPDQLAALRAQNEQERQGQQMVEGAPGVSQSALNLAKAQQALTQQPQGGGQ